MTSSTEKILLNFSSNVRKYRKALKLTQLELSIQTDVSEDYIHFLETGKRKPSFDVLIKLANALKVEPYELLK